MGFMASLWAMPLTFHLGVEGQVLVVGVHEDPVGSRLLERARRLAVWSASLAVSRSGLSSCSICFTLNRSRLRLDLGHAVRSSAIWLSMNAR
ncbi:MAG: hypothetical protein ACLSVD_01595 [Eggerthellaceae bacterium]